MRLLQSLRSFAMTPILIMTFILISVSSAHAANPKHVILISFDGLRPDAIAEAPAFQQLIKQGAATLKAHTDDDYTVTLPNHTSMITGYPVSGKHGHHVTENVLSDKKVDDYAGHHINSVFDMLHKHNRQSAMLASKLKFVIYKNSYPIDTVALTNQDDDATLKNFEELVRKGLPDFVFMHFAGTDHVGHTKGWSVESGSPYMQEVKVLDGYLAQIIQIISGDDSLKESTVLIITSDHGGRGQNHSDKTDPRNYTIPFIIWGKAVAHGVDLYTINIDRNKNKPIRNGDAANLALSLLGLPSVTGSTIGYQNPLKISKDSK